MEMTSKTFDPIQTNDRPYTRLVWALSKNHSNLTSLAGVLCHPSGEGAAAVVNFHDKGATSERFCSSAQLHESLHDGNSCARRLFLLEGLPADFIEVLGHEFDIDPNFFARQILSGMPRHASKAARDVPLLASHPSCRESFCLRYHELREFADPINDWDLQVMGQPRRVSVSKSNGDFDGIGIVRKNASAWFRVKKDGKAWDAIVLLDPPTGDQFYIGVEKRPCTLSSTLYRSGYVDFSPLPYKSLVLSDGAHGGPTRRSALEDLIYYYTFVEPPGKACYDSPVAVAGILKRYIASHWMLQLRYSLDLLVKYENTYHRACFFANLSSTLIQNSLRDVQHLNDRVAGWCEQVDRSLGQFKASGTMGSFPGQKTNDPIEDDFTHMLHELRELRARVQTVITSMTGLVSIIETMRMKELSLLAMVFIPLSLASGLFSMQGEYAPGESAFWIYCAVGLSLVLIVFLFAFGLTPCLSLIKTLKAERQALKKASRAGPPKELEDEAV